MMQRVARQLDVCRGCGLADVHFVFSLGSMPPVNAFLVREALDSERSYLLDVWWCARCTLVQLGSFVPPDELFVYYQHLSSASSSNLQHLAELAAYLCSRFAVTAGTHIFEVGSNDGSLLAHFLPATRHVLGVDPAINLVSNARQRGVNTLSSFLTPAVADDVVKENGMQNIVLALNVVAHTPDVITLLKAVRQVLAPDGVFVMEAVYVFDTILRGEFDTVYHEHAYCFSLTALTYVMNRVGFAIVDVERIPTQGGSLRVFAQRADGQCTVSPAVAALLADEEQRGVRNKEVYMHLGAGVRHFKEEFLEQLRFLHERHGRIFGLGAPARGVVLLNFCRIDRQLVEVVVDDTPLKQGRVVPGVHIPVISWNAFLQSDKPSAFLLLSWNYKNAFLERLSKSVPRAEVLLPFPEIFVHQLVSQQAHAVERSNRS